MFGPTRRCESLTAGALPQRHRAQLVHQVRAHRNCLLWATASEHLKPFQLILTISVTGRHVEASVFKAI
jgi:hypothetical protein